MTIGNSPYHLSFANPVTRTILLLSIVVYPSISLFHYSTDTFESQIITVELLIKLIHKTPTKVFPAPHGNTIKPDFA